VTTYRFGNGRLDLRTRELRVDGLLVPVEPQVFDVLVYLVEHRDRLVSKTELLDAVWGSQFVTESALTSRIKAARAAIGDDGAAQRLIRTQRGHGYRFVAAVEVVSDAGAIQPSPGALAPAPGAASTGPLGVALPAARVALVGRSDDLATADGLLRTHRCVTICGPGGVGKSTLALAVARAVTERGGADVSFVELAPVRTADEITRAVAEAIGVQTADTQTLVTQLAAHPRLLVLDNCEHLLDACARLVDRLLDASGSVEILATSREPLRVNGEAVLVLGSLGADAATLFAQRATEATGRAVVRADDPVVVTLCEQLDGLPLAIELAAAQLRHLTLAQLSERLDDRLAILVGGRPRAGDRHVSLAATIEWSHRLLEERERELFDRLGVFPASFDLDTAAAVSTTGQAETTNALGDLVAKSLVVLDEHSGRYRLLETIRLFAAGRLAESGRAASVRGQLRRHVVARTSAMPRTQAWLSGALAAANRDDIENVRLAFQECVAEQAYADAIDLTIGLSSLWRNAVSYAEGLSWVAELGRKNLASGDRLWLHLVSADLGLGSGDARLMADSAAGAERLLATVDDPGAAIITATYRALAGFSDPARAAKQLAEAAQRARLIGESQLDRLARGFAVVASLAAGDDDYVSAQLPTLATEVGDGYDRYICTWANWYQALVRLDGPSLRRCMAHQMGNVHASGLRENWLTRYCHALALIADGAPFLPALRQARHWAEAEGRRADLDCVVALSYAAACSGDYSVAAELLGASGGLFRDTAAFLHHMVIRDRIVRPRLSSDEFDDAVARGQSRPVAQILDAHDL
jgi:predicted ATPase/DNA-binding winged helix-turn-helix (wHTH) protein